MTPPDGKIAHNVQAWLQARQMQVPLTVACAFCGWSFHGTTGRALERARRHRESKHPGLKPQRKLANPSLRTWKARLSQLDDDDRATVLAEIGRRGRLHGVKATL